MEERPRCEHCGKFLSDQDLDSLYKGDTSKVDGKLVWTGGPVPEPSHDVYWHVKCEESQNETK